MARPIANVIMWPVLACSVAVSQPARSFEVASSRLNKTGGAAAMEFLPGGERFVATRVPLAILIVPAYGISAPQLSWERPALPVLTEKFDVQAKADHATSRAEMLQFLQSLLETRFKLVLRRETKELHAYALVSEKGGAKLRLSDVPHRLDARPLNPIRARGMEPRGGHLVFKDETMEEFAWALTTLVQLGDQVVVDRTGLSGHYDFDIKFGPDDAASPSGSPPLFGAIREQLGLRLDPRKIPLEILKVERADRPPEN